jgi:LuxR family maltose regulon positive regulatory protein
LISGDHFNGIGAVFAQERLFTQLGRLNEAAALCREAHHTIENVSKNTGRILPIAGVVYISMGNIHLEWNELDEAERQLNKGQELIALTTFPSARILGASATARLLNIRGNPALAIDKLIQAEALYPFTVPTLQAWKVRIWLGQEYTNPSDIAKAYHWAETSGLDLETDGTYSIGKLALVRVWISRRRAGPLDIHLIHRYLENQLKIARKNGYAGWELEVLILQALAYQADNHTALAVSALEKALMMAEHEGYMRIFLDEGARMAKLLQQIEEHTAVPDYVSSLIKTFTSEQKISSAFHTISPKGKLAAFHQLKPPIPPLIEPLSQRELEVLQLIADGASNPEIASALYITTNTVKKHISSLFSKMDAVSRTQAVRRGQLLGLIH